MDEMSLRTSNINRPLPDPTEHCTAGIYDTLKDDNQKTSSAMKSASRNTSTPKNGKADDDEL